VGDIYGTLAKLTFNLVSEGADSSEQLVSQQIAGTFLNFTKSHEISEGNLNLSFPSNAFYRSFYLNLNIDFTEAVYSAVYKVHNRFTPVHKSFSIKVKPDSIPDKMKDKLYLAYSSGSKKGQYNFISANWDGDYISAQSRSLGNYTIRIDTVAPEIIPVNIGEGKNISGQQTIQLKIRDLETGIKTYRPTLNGRWILMEYDPKKQLLTYEYEIRLKKGDNQFRLVVEDLLGNERVYEAILYY
jgi:hypothetical protein